MSQALDTKMLLDPEIIQDPYPFYRQLVNEAPVWQLPGTNFYAVSSYSLVAEAALRVDEFSNVRAGLMYRGEGGMPELLSFGDNPVQVLATADRPVHTLHKQIVFPDLVAKRMALLEPEVEIVAKECIDKALKIGKVDFMETIGNIVPITMISRLIGFKNSDYDQLLTAAFDSTSLVGGAFGLSELETLVTRTGEIQAWISEQLEAALESPEEDILGSISAGVKSGQLALQDAVIILHTLLSAGGESTTSLIGNAVRILADNPDLQKQLRENHELVPSFLEETLRLESPFRQMVRLTKCDVELGGVTIPADAMVFLFFAAANRDPAEFPNPDNFEIERKPRRHMAFGRGLHQCVGAPLARLESRIVLTQLLERTSNISLDPDQDAPCWVNNLQVRRHERLRVVLTPK